MENSKKNVISFLDKFYIGLLITVFGLIVFHAPISVVFGSFFPDLSLAIKAWKEILMAIAAVVILIILYRKNKFNLLKRPLIILIGVYILLHFAMLLIFNNGLKISLAGLLIDLRYVVFFVLVYLAICLYPESKRIFLKVGIVGSIIVLTFSLLQVFVLPKDTLKYIGYSKTTIAPYLLVDEDPNFVRINSTFRGPNPLGAYAGIILSLAVSFLALGGQKLDKNRKAIVALLLIGALVSLWASYSRSAILAACLAISAVCLTCFKNMSRKTKTIIGGVAIILVAVCSILLYLNPQFASNFLLHENPNNSSQTGSNKEHLSSLTNGVIRLFDNPLGGGIGSTGSASLYGGLPLIIENQYLLIAYETGWLGLAIFLTIYVIIMGGLWKKRDNWLALGVFVSGLGLAVIGFLLPVWTDDSVSVIWWGLAAIALYSKQDMLYTKDYSSDANTIKIVRKKTKE